MAYVTFFLKALHNKVCIVFVNSFGVPPSANSLSAKWPYCKEKKR